MSGRRRNHEGRMVDNRDPHHVDSFEDETITRLDFQRELRLLLSLLPQAEKHALVRMLVGLPPLDDAEERALRRARKRLSERGRIYV